MELPSDRYRDCQMERLEVGLRVNPISAMLGIAGFTQAAALWERSLYREIRQCYVVCGIGNRMKISDLKNLIKKWKTQILGGKVICIDPSVGSTSSLPGIAIYSRGKLIESGTIAVKGLARPVADRLRDIGEYLRARGEFDILVIEDVPVTPRLPTGKLNVHRLPGHGSLLKAWGAAVGAVNCQQVIALTPRQWKKYLPEGYKKTDEWDAKALGHALFKYVEEIEDGK